MVKKTEKKKVYITVGQKEKKEKKRKGNSYQMRSIHSFTFSVTRCRMKKYSLVKRSN